MNRRNFIKNSTNAVLSTIICTENSFSNDLSDISLDQKSADIARNTDCSKGVDLHYALDFYGATFFLPSGNSSFCYTEDKKEFMFYILAGKLSGKIIGEEYVEQKGEKISRYIKENNFWKNKDSGRIFSSPIPLDAAISFLKNPSLEVRLLYFSQEHVVAPKIIREENAPKDVLFVEADFSKFDTGIDTFIVSLIQKKDILIPYKFQAKGFWNMWGIKGYLINKELNKQ